MFCRIYRQGSLKYCWSKLKSWSVKRNAKYVRWNYQFSTERSYEIITVNYFCVRHKNRWKHNQHFKMLFFKENLHFGKSEQTSTYGKVNLLLIKSIYLIFSSRERQKSLIQTKVYHTSFFTLSEKKCLTNL